MKLLSLVFFLFILQAYSQDTTPRGRSFTFENDTLTRSEVIEYNDLHLRIYSISVNHKRNDTTEIFTHYNNDNKLAYYVQNGPYFRDRFDTTFYTYEKNITIITNRSKNSLHVRKLDSLNRRMSSFRKSFDDFGRLIIHDADSTFYDDSTHTERSVSYRKIDIPLIKIEADLKFNPDKEVLNSDKNLSKDLSDSIFNKKKFELKNESIVRKNAAGQALEIKSGNGTAGKYKYDSLGRLVYLEVRNSHKSDTTFMKYTYETIGDTLIKTDWKLQSANDISPVKGTVYKESVSQIDGQALWSQVFIGGELFSDSKRIYNEQNQIIKLINRRMQEGRWIETKHVYEYEEF